MSEWYIAAIVFRSRSISSCKVFAGFLFIVLLSNIPAKAFDRKPLLSILDLPDQRSANSVLPAEKGDAFFDRFPFISYSAKARAFIKAPLIVQDGEQREFSVQIAGGEAAAYEWSFEARSKTKTPALIEFSSPNAATTKVQARWYARTRGGCSADFTSLYLIKLKVKLRNGNELTENFPLTVEVPHNWGGYVDYPETTGSPEIGFDENNGVWFVKGAGTLERIVQQPVIKAVKTSQFFNKIKTHEEIHQQQMKTGIFADLFQINSLMPLIQQFSNTNRQQLEQKVFETIQKWRAGEAQKAIEWLPKAEKEAYKVSDQIEPKYLFNNCERFK